MLILNPWHIQIRNLNRKIQDLEMKVKRRTDDNKELAELWWTWIVFRVVIDEITLCTFSSQQESQLARLRSEYRSKLEEFFSQKSSYASEPSSGETEILTSKNQHTSEKTMPTGAAGSETSDETRPTKFRDIIAELINNFHLKEKELIQEVDDTRTKYKNLNERYSVLYEESTKLKQHVDDMVWNLYGNQPNAGRFLAANYNYCRN